MAEYAKKSAMGYKVIDRYSDATNVILSKEEYEQMRQEKRSLEWQIQSERMKLTEQLQKVKDDARTQTGAANALAKNYEREIQNMQAQLTEAQDRIALFEELNRSLLRISKERANAERELRPKKEHTGYVPLSSTEKNRHSEKGKSVTLWETILQTPYSVELIAAEVKLLTENEETACLLEKIGITGDRSSDCQKKGLDKVMEELSSNENVILTRTLRANFRAGCWEVLLQHTKPLGIIPKEMRFR